MVTKRVRHSEGLKLRYTTLGREPSAERNQL